MMPFTPVFHSPIAAEGQHQTLTLTDLTGAPITLIQGEAGAALKKALPADLPARPGDVVDAGEALLCRLTPTELYLFGKSPAPGPPQSGLQNESAPVTDLTHGRAALKLSGSAAAETLSKLCGLDFHDSAFPNLQVKQTSAAKIKILIARCDEGDAPTYFLHVARSLGQYFWDTLRDAMMNEDF